MTHAVLSSKTTMFSKSASAQARLHELIPGGAHAYARGSDQYPEDMTPILVRGRGARVEDLDGNWFVEYGMGLRSITLGHGYEPVVSAVSNAASAGVNFSRPSVWELRAAEDFLAHLPGADMVKFAKNGSDTTTAAIKLARAATGRDLVAICGSQPFFSVDDWFVATTHMTAGIPSAYGSLTVQFSYNNLDSVHALFDAYPGRIAAVILEAATSTAEPAPGFLEGLRSATQQHGAVLIFDEMITGMRWSRHGAQSVYGVTPDLSTWGKAIGNGFAVSALAGKRELMEAGGLNTDMSRVFLLSTTHGAEATGLAAYLAVSEAYAERDVVAEMESQGTKLRSELEQVTEEAGMSAYVSFPGRPSCLVFATKDHNGQPSQAFRTLFIQELLRRGVLGQSLVISAAHTDSDIDQTIDAVAGALQVYARAIEACSTDGLLVGRPVAPSLREFAAPRRLQPPDSPVRSG
jgi:glutamate-1-semialdehyde 2,1-aminomutase